MNHHCVNISRHIFHCNYNNPCTVRELHSAKSNAAEANTGSMLKPCQDGYQTQRERNVYSRTNRLHQQPEQKRLRHSATLVLLANIPVRPQIDNETVEDTENPISHKYAMAWMSKQVTDERK
jgi:hypothetical protein